MEAFKTKPNGRIDAKDGSFEPLSRTPIKAIIPHGNSWYRLM